jgi:hypothetical protein
VVPSIRGVYGPRTSSVPIVLSTRDASLAGGAVLAGTRMRLLRGTAVYLALGTLLNAVSRSPVERVWSPVNAAGAVLLWQAAQPSDVSAASAA